jgi:hypothetical protein
MAAASIAKTKRAHLSGAKIDRIFEEFRRSPATLSLDEVSEIDRSLMHQPYGVSRRAALLAYTSSGAELLELANRDREGALVVAWTAEAAKRAAEGLRELADLIDGAGMRAKMALCERAGMQSVLAEAEATYSGDGMVGHA